MHGSEASEVRQASPPPNPCTCAGDVSGDALDTGLSLAVTPGLLKYVDCAPTASAINS